MSKLHKAFWQLAIQWNMPHNFTFIMQPWRVYYRKPWTIDLKDASGQYSNGLVSFEQKIPNRTKSSLVMSACARAIAKKRIITAFYVATFWNTALNFLFVVRAEFESSYRCCCCRRCRRQRRRRCHRRRRWQQHLNDNKGLQAAVNRPIPFKTFSSNWWSRR